MRWYSGFNHVILAWLRGEPWEIWTDFDVGFIYVIDSTTTEPNLGVCALKMQIIRIWMMGSSTIIEIDLSARIVQNHLQPLAQFPS